MKKIYCTVLCRSLRLADVDLKVTALIIDAKAGCDTRSTKAMRLSFWIPIVLELGSFEKSVDGKTSLDAGNSSPVSCFMVILHLNKA